MCNLYSITTNQAAIAGLFRRMNRYVGNLEPVPGVFPDYPAPVIRNAGEALEMVLMRWGMPPPPRNGRTARHQHPQYLVTALAHVAEAGKPLPGAVQQLCRIRTRAEPQDEEKGRRLVCAERLLTSFADVWIEFKGGRGTMSKPVPGPQDAIEIAVARLLHYYRSANRTGTVLGPPTNVDAERFGSPVSSRVWRRGINSSNRTRISSRARCWPRQAWAPVPNAM
jgi:hypothetical protein